MNLRTIVAFFYVASLLVLPGVAHGHAFPDHSDPRVGATLSSPPAGAYIWFDGDLEPAFSRITVQDADRKKSRPGQRPRESVQFGPPRSRPASAAIGHLSGNLERGIEGRPPDFRRLYIYNQMRLMQC